MNYFAISDIHGHANELNRLLECWNPDNQELVLLGDYIDRGHYSLDVLKTVKRLGEEYGAILLKGNHEDMLLGFLEEKGDLDSYYFEHAAVETILSLLEDERLNRFNISLMYNADEIRDIIMSSKLYILN